MSPLWRHALLVLVLAGGAGLACGAEEEEDWPLAIRLYLFAALAQPPDAVVVEASQQGGAPQTVTLDHPFASCEQNQVQIVPGQDAQGVFLPVTVTVTTEDSILASETIALTQTTGEQIEALVVGDPASPSLAPAGSCKEHLPPVQSKDLGEPCDDDHECTLEFCLNYMSLGGNNIFFPLGTCSLNCSGEESCPEGSECVWATDSYSNQIEGQAYCLKTCDPDPESCREKYECTNGGICFPTP